MLNESEIVKDKLIRQIKSKNLVEMSNPMDGIQQQINTLDQKVDGLRCMVEQLSIQVTQSISDNQQKNEQFSSPNQHSRPSYKSTDSVMEHKDILVDSNTWDNYSEQNYNQPVPAEIQIRRLTAQLTAAYNRIAALEEQLLLARRIHS